MSRRKSTQELLLSKKCNYRTSLPFSLSLSIQTSSRQIPCSYSASESKKYALTSVARSFRMRSLAFRYNRTCVAKLSTTVPVQKSNQSISRNLKTYQNKQTTSFHVFLHYQLTFQLNVELYYKFHS